MARSRPARYRILLLAALAAFPIGLSAQRADSTVWCDGMDVKSVGVETNRPPFSGAMAWWRKFARTLGLHHETTAQGLVRRFVTLDKGQGCTEFRRSESERILRAQPFLADASVTTTQVGDSVRVDVATVDEVSLVAAARLGGSRIQALSLGTLNFRGAGMHVEGRWENGRSRRDGFGAKLAHYQVLGRPYSLVAEGARRPLGENYSVVASHPLLTDLQRIAWHAGFLTNKDFAHLRKPDRSELLQPLDRSMWSVGGVLRVGPSRRLWLAGGMLLGERMVPRNEFLVLDSASGRLLPSTDTAGVRQYPVYSAANFAGVLGLRALKYSRMRGLDAVAAEQDVATGTQVGAMLGIRPWSLVPLRDAFGTVDGYAASRSRRNFVGARAEIESRLNLERGDWRHLIASGRAAWYFKPMDRWTSELAIEVAGGWRTIIPFQLDLGDRIGGVRGYARSLEAGAQRALARFEQRFDLARYKTTRAALGAAVFTDAGRMWAGDVPFGIDTPIRASFGAGIIAAIPAASQRTIRAELAVPMTRSQGARPELRFTVREPARGFWAEPPRIRLARLSAIPELIFSWP